MSFSPAMYTLRLYLTPIKIIRNSCSPRTVTGMSNIETDPPLGDVRVSCLPSETASPEYAGRFQTDRSARGCPLCIAVAVIFNCFWLKIRCCTVGGS